MLAEPSRRPLLGKNRLRIRDIKVTNLASKIHGHNHSNPYLDIASLASLSPGLPDSMAKQKSLSHDG